MSRALEHHDETGKVCERHAPASLEPVLQLAAIGSRMASYNHDLASKIQGLMMALDEIGELTTPLGNGDLDRATETANTALRELNDLLNLNRTLTKPSVKARIAVRELFAKAGERAGVAVRGSLPEATIEVAVALTVQALALAFDAAAGTGRNRKLEITVTGNEISAPFAATATPASEQLALAAWLLAREGCQLLCTSDARLVICLPT
ncbi:MAG: hypothetical protein ABI867_23195 [Kofleriaceae bacterium]